MCCGQSINLQFLFIPGLSQFHNLQLPLLQPPIHLTTSQTSFTQGILFQTLHYLTTTSHLSSSLVPSILNLIFYIIESSGILTSPIIVQDIKSLPGLISFLSQAEPHNSEPLFINTLYPIVPLHSTQLA